MAKLKTVTGSLLVMKDLEEFECAIEEVIGYFYKQKKISGTSRHYAIICADIEDLDKVKSYLQTTDSNISAACIINKLNEKPEKHNRGFPIYINCRSFLFACDTEEIYISKSACSVEIFRMAKELRKIVRPASECFEMA